MVPETIEERGGELLVAGKHRDPLGEGEIGRHDGGAAFVAVGDEIEEQLAAGAIERTKPSSSMIRTSTLLNS